MYDIVGILGRRQACSPACPRQIAQSRGKACPRAAHRHRYDGRPIESSAHPHATDRLAVVHNDIIENELREELEKKNVRFGSDTDTEVVAHLVTEEMKNLR